MTSIVEGSSPRVDALVATTNGFELAEIDLELRGEGTILGTRQKGRSDLKLASLRRDKQLVEQARDAAFTIVDADPELQRHVLLRDELEALSRPRTRSSCSRAERTQLLGRSNRRPASNCGKRTTSSRNTARLRRTIRADGALYGHR